MSNTSDFVDLLQREIEELQKAIREPIKCANTATEIERDISRRIMLENQLHYKQGCLSKNYYYESQINDLNAKIEEKDQRIQELEEQLAITEKALKMACEQYYEDCGLEDCPESMCDSFTDNYDKCKTCFNGGDRIMNNKGCCWVDYFKTKAKENKSE